MEGWTDGRTDGRTDRPTYRDAWTHLKIINEMNEEDRECPRVEKRIWYNRIHCQSPKVNGALKRIPIKSDMNEKMETGTKQTASFYRFVMLFEFLSSNKFDSFIPSSPLFAF